MVQYFKIGQIFYSSTGGNIVFVLRFYRLQAELKPNVVKETG
jgi:hypothetical protein